MLKKTCSILCLYVLNKQLYTLSKTYILLQEVKFLFDKSFLKYFC
jgi:hypothetical protein